MRLLLSSTANKIAENVLDSVKCLLRNSKDHYFVSLVQHQAQEDTRHMDCGSAWLVTAQATKISG
jgi:hypothetical protein